MINLVITHDGVRDDCTEGKYREILSKCRTYAAGEGTVHSCDKETSQGLKNTL